MEEAQDIIELIDVKTKITFYLSNADRLDEMHAVVPSTPKKPRIDIHHAHERGLVLPLRNLISSLQEELRVLRRAQKLVDSEEIGRLEFLCQKWKEASATIFRTIQANWHEEIGMEDLMIAGGFNPDTLNIELDLDIESCEFETAEFHEGPDSYHVETSSTNQASSQ